MVVRAATSDLQPSDFVHLHNHTHHSLLDGLTKMSGLMAKVKEFGMEAVAITDHGTMSGVIEFYKEAEESGIQPIIGMEAYVAARSRFDRDPAKDKTRYHLTILAMNEQGYRNMMKLASKASLEGFYYKPRIDHELLEEHNEGLIILSGCASGEVAENLRIDNYEEAKRIALWYKSIFGDRYYLELQDHGHPESSTAWSVQTKINNHLLEMIDDIQVPGVVTCDGHYLEHDDKDAHEILLCVGTAAFLSDQNRMSLRDFDLHVTDPKDIIKRWGKLHPDLILNTKKIAERCNLEIQLGGILIPKFPIPEGESEKSYLDKLTFAGLARRFLSKTDAEIASLSTKDIRQLLPEPALERADMELAVMDRMGYNGYFLIVQDFINWGKSEGIVFGPGRGSAAGSIVAYALNITDLDPLEYGLLFERFLNPDRISMPDIDIDIQDTRRDEVIAYCANKYGDDRVANIVTFGRMAARAAVRDVARVLQVPYSEADRLSKMIPAPIQGRHIPLSSSIKDNPELKAEYEVNPVSKEVIDYAIRLEGTIRSHGVHAAGVVIAPDSIVNYVPLEMAQKGVVSTQYPMGPVEDIGLLKMDFLGLSNLTTIRNTLRIIRKVYGKEVDLSKLSLKDESTYRLLQRGDTTGVFQLESAGMKRYLRDLVPSSFDDIIAMGALYRPGPMQFIESFIKRKHGKEAITYLHDGLKPSLESTYGILVYQEQFMQISKDWAGFTGGQADTLRKAVGKKKIDLMMQVKPEFIEGAVKHGGATKEIAEKFWNQLEEFANYSFNKSHAACYGLISYWTAFLKAHYPDAFMAALMASDHKDIDRLAIEIAECKYMGIQVLSPDINQSYGEFAVVDGKKAIRFGMAAVKGVGDGAADAIVEARKQGRFLSIEDFARRVSVSKVNRKSWESLIKAGAFDSFADRSDLLFNLDDVLAYGSKVQKEALSGQVNLFGDLLGGESQAGSELRLLPAPAKYTDKERLAWERELLGLYISAHPLDGLDDFLDEQTVSFSSLSPDSDGAAVTIGGLISSVRTIVTKSGSKMAFLRLEDKQGEGEVVIFPKLFEQVGAKLIQDAILKINGRVSARGRGGELVSEVKVIADDLSVVTEGELESYESTGKSMSGPVARKQPLVKKRSKPVADKVNSPTTNYKRPDSSPVSIEKPDKKILYVQIKDPNNHQALASLKQSCSLHPGLAEIVLVLGDAKKSALKLPFKVDASESLIGKLVKELGEDAVILK